MQKNIFIALIAAAIILIGGYLIFKSGGSQTPDQTSEVKSTPSQTSNNLLENDNTQISESQSISSQTSNTQSSSNTETKTSNRTIVFDEKGFSPNELKIQVGDTVTFKNKSTGPFWPASAIHPTHKVYPGSDISKCSTEERNKIFDACKPIKVGGEWSFKFDFSGKWKYHDHLSPGYTGTIIVE